MYYVSWNSEIINIPSLATMYCICRDRWIDFIGITPRESWRGNILKTDLFYNWICIYNEPMVCNIGINRNTWLSSESHSHEHFKWIWLSFYAQMARRQSCLWTMCIHTPRGFACITFQIMRYASIWNVYIWLFIRTWNLKKTAIKKGTAPVGTANRTFS